MRDWRGVGLGMAAAAAVAMWIAPPGRAAESAGETRAVGHFDRVKSDGYFRVNVRADSSRLQVTVSGDPSTVARVTTTVDEGTLELGMTSGTNLLRRPPVVTIDVPTLRSFENAGAGNVTIVGLRGGVFSLSNAGAAAVSVAGRVDLVDITLDGVGKIDAAGLDARDVTVDNNGVGRVDVRSSGTLRVSVNGVGEVRYAGQTAHVDGHVNGIGRIVHL